MNFNSKFMFVPGLLTHQDLCIVSLSLFFTLCRSPFFLFATLLTSNINTLIWELLPFLFSSPDARLAADNMYSGRAGAHCVSQSDAMHTTSVKTISVHFGFTRGDLQ